MGIVKSCQYDLEKVKKKLEDRAQRKKKEIESLDKKVGELDKAVLSCPASKEAALEQLQTDLLNAKRDLHKANRMTLYDPDMVQLGIHAFKHALVERAADVLNRRDGDAEVVEPLRPVPNETTLHPALQHCGTDPTQAEDPAKFFFPLCVRPSVPRHIQGTPL